jgi:hypothetical protein
MNWDAIGAVGEIVGASAVFVSLIYLAVQIRNQNREARAAAMHEIWVGFRDSIAAFGDQQTSQVYTKALAHEELSDAEQLQLIVGVQRILRVWEEAFMQKNKGRLDDEVWEAMVVQYSSTMGSRAFQIVWELRKEVYGSEFRRFVDDLPVSDYQIRENAK